jgi:hypothetical protein
MTTYILYEIIGDGYACSCEESLYVFEDKDFAELVSLELNEALKDKNRYFDVKTIDKIDNSHDAVISKIIEEQKRKWT